MVEQTNLNEGWEEVKESNFWNPEKEGDSIEGVIISMNKEEFGLKVVIETKDKKMITLPSHKVLQNRLLICKVGDLVRVIFDKKELPKIKGHNPTNIYRVLVKKQ